MIRLRPATMDDAERLREWRNDPETVAASLTGRAVEPDEHRAWLELVIDHPGERLFVIEDDGEPVGQVRVQRQESGEAEVHIGLAPEARGRGLGRAVLDLAAGEAGAEVLVAHVLADNERSLRAFAGAGFTERSREGRTVLLERRLPSPPVEADRDTTEQARLEELWSGDFGDAYVDRNAEAERGRERFWRELLEGIEPASALEVGCNVGGNLRWVAESVPSVTGVDVNEKALERLAERVPGATGVLASGTGLPFEDGDFDLVFTMGVLIHQSTEELPAMMSEVVRCSSRWVLCGEYYSEQDVEVPYRGHRGALFKRDYGRLYAEAHPELHQVDQGFLPASEGTWDDVTWWLFDKGE